MARTRLSLWNLPWVWRAEKGSWNPMTPAIRFQKHKGFGESIFLALVPQSIQSMTQLLGGGWWALCLWTAASYVALGGLNHTESTCSWQQKPGVSKTLNGSLSSAWSFDALRKVLPTADLDAGRVRMRHIVQRLSTHPYVAGNVHML